MFTKSLFGYRMETQGRILDRIAALVDAAQCSTQEQCKEQRTK